MCYMFNLYIKYIIQYNNIRKFKRYCIKCFHNFKYRLKGHACKTYAYNEIGVAFASFNACSMYNIIPTSIWGNCLDKQICSVQACFYNYPGIAYI